MMFVYPEEVVKLYFQLPLPAKQDIVKSLNLGRPDDADLNMIDQDKTHMKRAIDLGLLNKVWEKICNEGSD